MAWPTTALGTDTSGYDYLDQSYRRKAVFTVPDKKIRMQHVDQLIFKNLIGKAGDGKKKPADMSPIVYNRDLTKERGDTIRMFLQPKITGNGVSGDGVMYGSEAILDFAYLDVHINQIRHGVKTHGKASDQRGLFNILERARPGLTEWYSHRFEEDIIYALYYGWSQNIVGTAATYYGLGKNSSSVKPARYWYCADSVNNSIAYSGTDATYIGNIETAEGTLTDVASDRFSPDILEGASTLMDVNNFKRMSAGGFSGYLCIIHGYQLNQLRTNEKWFQANITAGPRDTEGNPVFAGKGNNGYVGMWNDVVIFRSNKVHSAAESAANGETLIDGAADSDVRRALFCGAGAICIAEGGEYGTPNLVYEESDYGNKKGVVLRSMYGMARGDYTLDTNAATLYAQSVMVVSTKSPATTL